MAHHNIMFPLWLTCQISRQTLKKSRHFLFVCLFVRKKKRKEKVKIRFARRPAGHTYFHFSEFKWFLRDVVGFIARYFHILVVVAYYSWFLLRSRFYTWTRIPAGYIFFGRAKIWYEVNWNEVKSVFWLIFISRASICLVCANQPSGNTAALQLMKLRALVLSLWFTGTSCR